MEHLELFLGRLHPLIVHFPIGLLAIALLMEAFTIGGRRPGLREGINWMVFLGAAFAVLAAILGWFLRTIDDYSGELVQLHQNLGIVTAVLASATALVLQITLKGRWGHFRFYRATLTATVVSLIITSHLGASLTHGVDFLSSAWQYQLKLYDDTNSLALLAELQPLDSLTDTQQDQLNLEVRAIFAHNCYQCHSEHKQKGELVLENKRGVYKGGKSGKVIVAGAPESSEMYRRISLPSNHDDVMPKKGKILKGNEIALIKLWIEKGAHWADRALEVFPEASLALHKPSLPQLSGGLEHPVDKLMQAYFEEHNFEWPSLVDDHTFIRRAYLDIIGLLPGPENIKNFVQDRGANKRNKLIDNLLEDQHNYTQHWLSFWNDLLRNDYSGTGFITGGRKQITHWLYTSLVENKSYNLMVKELMNPTEESEGFIKGIKWRGVVNASQTTEMQAAQNISQSLMGMNLKCASCHNSFVSNLSLDQAYGFASIFADSALELYRCDKPLGKMAKVEFLYTELGSVEAETLKERLSKLSEVMVKRENGRLYRTITNRIWKQLLGRGLIEPADEMDNTPWSADLLDWLASDFIDSGHDLKHLIRMIMTSKAYQLPSVNYKEIAEIASDQYAFKGPVIRRLSAEQFSDAVSQIIAPVYHATAYNPTTENMSSDRIWHREIKFDRDVLPEPGDRYFRYVFTLPDQEVQTARLLISVDHSYKLYINGKSVSQGTDWRKVGRLDVSGLLINGKNLIALKGSNEGKIANPAGVLLTMKVMYEKYKEILISSGVDWKSTAVEPAKNWNTLEFNDEDWIQVRNYGSKHWDRLVNLTFEDHGYTFARASLVRQHPFMKLLGRPTRENVTTTRDQQATLLQALELTNGDYFNSILSEGANLWYEKFGNDRDTIANALYQQSFGRSPSKQERQLVVDALGEPINKEALQDVFWATLLSPEFQFIF